MARPNIVQMFHDLNALHFNGEIPNIPVVWNSRLTTTAGRCHLRADGPGRTALRPTKIDLAGRVFEVNEWDEAKVKRTLIHEMVHAFLIHKHDEKGHTARFHRMMTRITGEKKNHRCHSYKVARVRNVGWMCPQCKTKGMRTKMPPSWKTYTHTCGTKVKFFDLRKPSNAPLRPLFERNISSQ